MAKKKPEAAAQEAAAPAQAPEQSQAAAPSTAPGSAPADPPAPPAVPPAPPAKLTKVELPKSVTLTHPYGFYDDEERLHSWSVGQVVIDPAEIATLVERAAPIQTE